VLGDFSQYVVVDRVGMSIAFNPLVVGSNRRPTGEIGWAAFWRVGADVDNANGFRLLVVSVVGLWAWVRAHPDRRRS
jgi:HK97 family phage major capsid protein